jgi:hypothetical protein
MSGFAVVPYESHYSIELYAVKTGRGDGCKGSHGFVLLYVFGKTAEIVLAILG